MPKRKRSGREAAEAKVAEYKAKLYSTLWDVKGHLRQWQSKQIRAADKKDPKKARIRKAPNQAEPDKDVKDVKKERLEKEVLVLKSLDLHQAAHAHLVSSLLKISAIAESPDVPEVVKKGVSRPDVSDEQKAAVHNVTSALYNRPEVKKIIQQAIEAVCDALEVPVPQKKGKEKKKKDSGEKKPSSSAREDRAGELQGKPTKERPLASKEPKNPQTKSYGRTDDDLDDDEQELAVSRFEEMLGSSSGDDDSDSNSEDGVAGRGSLEEKDPMQISSDEEGDDGYDEISLEDSEDELGDDDDDDEDNDDDDNDDDDNEEEKLPRAKDKRQWDDYESEADSSDSEAIERPPPRKKLAASKKLGKSKSAESVFLPTLMGGYISGSESASDVDVAPSSRKNRRGQKARQAIWEKKYRQEAKHLKNGDGTTWDPKRGAVSADKGRSRKKGTRDAFAEPSWGQPERRGGKPQKTEIDNGPLHPSWEASRKAKQMEKTAKFEGTKVTFD